MHHFSRSRPISRARSQPWRAAARLGALATVLILSGCAAVGERLPAVPSITGLITPYRIDIQQGNVVTREQAQALQVGLSRQQVRQILGSPLLSSIFHGERWDYVFTLQRQGQEPQQRRLTVFFKDDVLERVESDELPTQNEFVAALAHQRVVARPLPLQATPEQLSAFLERHPPLAAPTPVPPTPGRVFPPLEAGAGAAR